MPLSLLVVQRADSYWKTDSRSYFCIECLVSQYSHVTIFKVQSFAENACTKQKQKQLFYNNFWRVLYFKDTILCALARLFYAHNAPLSLVSQNSMLCLQTSNQSMYNDAFGSSFATESLFGCGISEVMRLSGAKHYLICNKAINHIQYI